MTTCVAIDTETYPIQPGLKAPRLVCVSFANRTTREDIIFPGDPPQREATPNDPMVCGVWDAEDGVKAVRNMLKSGAHILGHNISYDVGVLLAADPRDEHWALWLDAYAEGRVHDTMIRQRLINNAAGELEFKHGRPARYSLAHLTLEHTGVDTFATKDGPDIWRLRYHELDGVPVEDWPIEAYDYARDDAVHTLEVFESQGYEVVNEAPMVEAAFFLHLATAWGMRTDAARVAALRAELEAQVGDLTAEMQGHGIVRADGSTNKKALEALVSKAYHGNPPMTEKGNIKTSTDVLVASGDPILVRLGIASKPKWHLANTVPNLESAVDVPACCRYGLPQASGRTSSYGGKVRKGYPRDGFNIQNLARKGGFRECFEPRTGRVFVVADYSQLELCTFAQVCLWLFGESAMADAIKEGKDLHLVLASEMLGVPYYAVSKATHKKERETCKAGNYMFLTLAHEETFKKSVLAKVAAGDLGEDFAKFSTSEAKDVRDAFMRAWPEAKLYGEHVADISDIRGGHVVQFLSGRVRGGCTFTQAANSFFQGLAADGALRSVVLVGRECYDRRLGSVLYGSRIVAFIHDEIVLESPEEVAHECAMRLSELMVEGMREFVPDVPIEAEPLVTRLWSKKAEETYLAEGSDILVPWSPAIAAADKRDSRKRLIG